MSWGQRQLWIKKSLNNWKQIMVGCFMATHDMNSVAMTQHDITTPPQKKYPHMVAKQHL